MIFSCQRPQKLPEPVPTSGPFQLLSNISIPIDNIAFQHLASKPNLEVFNVSLRDIEQALKLKVKTDPTTALPEVYKEFLKLFILKKAKKLLPYSPEVNHTMYMQPGTQPQVGPLYGMSRNELQVLKKYLKDNLSKVFIWALLSPAAALVLFVKKLGDSLQFVWTIVALILSLSRTSTSCHGSEKPWTSYVMQYISPSSTLLQPLTKSAWQLKRNKKLLPGHA